MDMEAEKTFFACSTFFLWHPLISLVIWHIWLAFGG